MEKKTYRKPLLMVERFMPQTYCSNCTWKQSDSSEGQFIYGWVVMCGGPISVGGVSYGHGERKCPDYKTFEKQAGGTLDGTFVQSYAAGQYFTKDNVVGTNVKMVTSSGVETTEYAVGNYLIVGDHAFKLNGSTEVSQPLSQRYDVNMS